MSRQRRLFLISAFGTWVVLFGLRFNSAVFTTAVTLLLRILSGVVTKKHDYGNIAHVCDRVRDVPRRFE